MPTSLFYISPVHIKLYSTTPPPRAQYFPPYIDRRIVTKQCISLFYLLCPSFRLFVLIYVLWFGTHYFPWCLAYMDIHLI